MTQKADLVIIGGGPAGYVAALCAARIGASVVLVEKDALGGTCLNRGCIPSKALIRVARTLRSLARAGEMGIRVDDWSVDLEGVRRWRDRPVRVLVRGVEQLLAAAGVEVVRGRAALAAAGAVDVEPEGGGGSALRYEAPKVFVATGSLPAPLPLPGGGECWDSDRALALEGIPAALAIVGGGPVGVEMAEVYAALGARVSVIEFLPRLLPREDAELGAALGRSLQRRGINVLTSTRLVSLGKGEEGGYRLDLAPAGSDGDGAAGVGDVPSFLEVEAVMAAVGRRPAVRGLGLDRVGLSEGWLQTDSFMQTSVPGLYAIGDVTGRSLLAHAGSAQGIVAAEHAFGREPTVNLETVPSCTYTWPEVASVGLSEEAARSRGHRVIIGRFPFSANGKAAAAGEREGLVKVVAEEGSRRLLGCHIFGPEASLIIHEAALALVLGATLSDVERTIHAHPTYSEAFAEGCLAADGKALHHKAD